MKMKHTLLAAAALSLLSTTASAVDWGGYFRVGPGQKATTGDGAKCFGANMDGGTFRLGNECNTYGEFMLSQGGQAGGVDYKAYLMVCWLFMVAQAFTLAKTLRDAHEARTPHGASRAAASRQCESDVA